MENIKKKFNYKKLAIYIFIILILIITILYLFYKITLGAFYTPLDPLGLNSCKYSFAEGCDIYSINKFFCPEEAKQTTILKKSNIKATFECVNNLKKVYSYSLLLKNNNILFYNQGKNKNFCEPVVYDTKTNKFISVNSEELEEKDFIYGKSKSLPANKQFINDKTLFNFENNRLYYIPAKNMEKYNKFINKAPRKYENSSTISVFEDGTSLKYGYSSNTDKYDILWLEDNIKLIHYKPIKLDIQISEYNIKSVKYYNEIIIADKDKLYLYNPKTGNTTILKKFNNESVIIGLFIYQNKIVIPKIFDLSVEIFDLKTKKFETYKMNIPDKKIDVNANTVLLPSGYLLFYTIYSDYSYLFDINIREGFKVKNFNPEKLGFSKVCSSDNNYDLIPVTVSASELLLAGGRCLDEKLVSSAKVNLDSKGKLIIEDRDGPWCFYSQDLSIRKFSIEKINK